MKKKLIIPIVIGAFIVGYYLIYNTNSQTTTSNNIQKQNNNILSKSDNKNIISTYKSDTDIKSVDNTQTNKATCENTQPHNEINSVVNQSIPHIPSNNNHYNNQATKNINVSKQALPISLSDFNGYGVYTDCRYKVAVALYNYLIGIYPSSDKQSIVNFCFNEAYNLPNNTFSGIFNCTNATGIDVSVTYSQDNMSSVPLNSPPYSDGIAYNYKNTHKMIVISPTVQNGKVQCTNIVPGVVDGNITSSAFPAGTMYSIYRTQVANSLSDYISKHTHLPRAGALQSLEKYCIQTALEIPNNDFQKVLQANNYKTFNVNVYDKQEDYEKLYDSSSTRTVILKYNYNSINNLIVMSPNINNSN